MQAILIAISEGVNVVGTLAWSIYDNFEWGQGYSAKFGIQVSVPLVMYEVSLSAVVCQLDHTGEVLQG